MGPVRATLVEPQENAPGYFLSIHGRDRYPTWDEIVWLRYNLIPDAARMALILPNLNSYINQEDTAFKFVFTMEQQGWAVDPPPQCEAGHGAMEITGVQIVTGLAVCPVCGASMEIDLRTWNERHGNGFRAGAQR